jgi:hypothetical protein
MKYSAKDNNLEICKLLKKEFIYFENTQPESANDKNSRKVKISIALNPEIVCIAFAIHIINTRVTDGFGSLKFIKSSGAKEKFIE